MAPKKTDKVSSEKIIEMIRENLKNVDDLSKISVAIEIMMDEIEETERNKNLERIKHGIII